MKIAVINLNPGIDRVFYLKTPLEVGQLNRADKVVLSQGSKAVNFAIILKRLSVDCDYFSFDGGSFADVCRSFTEKEGIRSFFVGGGYSRLNVKVIDSHGTYTEINERGAEIDRGTLDSLLTLVSQKTYDYIILSGSLPRGVHQNTYAEIIKRCHNTNTKVILDCSADALRLSIAAKPLLIKPNRVEMAELCGENIESFSDTGRSQKFAEKFYKRHGVSVLLSLDADGAVYAGDGGTFYQSAAKTELVGFAGAGDTLNAAFFVSRYVRGSTVKKALTFASAAAGAKLSLEGSELPTELDVMRVMENNGWQ